ncbi:MAG: tRNA uracil 4-sulfurtransferase ThiI [bacterium]|nr:tRNA uracil 4-sulfurtransferase ThiI [bacterium]
MNLFVIRYAEIALKGSNREWFEKRLLMNLRQHLDVLGKHHTWKVHGRMMVETELDPILVAKTLAQVPGVANFSLARHSSHDLGQLAEACQAVMGEYLTRYPETVTFKAECKRADKTFPLNSQQLAAEVGGYVLDQHPDLKVKLVGPDVELGVEIWPGNKAAVYLEKQKGQGGLPVGTSGKMISFLSGGIDSPVASWMMMRRGVEVVYLNFHSFPFIGEESKEKVVQLVQHLSRYQPKSTLYIAPFTEIQKAIKQHCDERYRTILYRRLMYRIANALAHKLKIKGYVTGEALGQVASQTIENLACTEAAADLPVLRPLIGLEKGQIIDLAREIGSYNISVQPFPDCCTVFQPRKPETRGELEVLAEQEAKVDFAPLIQEAVENLEKHQFVTQVQEQFFD